MYILFFRFFLSAFFEYCHLHASQYRYPSHLIVNITYDECFGYKTPIFQYLSDIPAISVSFLLFVQIDICNDKKAAWH